jgi:hypothetical protein
MDRSRPRLRIREFVAQALLPVHRPILVEERPFRAAKAIHSFPVILSESVGANATKDESKDPGNAQVLNADSGSSHKTPLFLSFAFRNSAQYLALHPRKPARMP